MTEATEMKTSPVGEIFFMAVENTVKDSNNDPCYTMRIAFDIEKDKEWLEWVSEINNTKVVTSDTTRSKSDSVKEVLSQGKALVSANSKYKPEVFSAATGAKMEDNPMFFSGSSGTAQMIVEPYRGEKGGTINLIGVIIHSLEQGEVTTVDRAARAAQLQDLVNKTIGK